MHVHFLCYFTEIDTLNQTNLNEIKKLMTAIKYSRLLEIYFLYVQYLSKSTNLATKNNVQNVYYIYYSVLFFIFI